MAGFNPLERGGLVLLPAKGASGATGIAGSGSVFQSVDALSATPRSVSDWGPLINTAYTNGARHFVFGAFDYPFATTLNFVNSQGVILEGAAGRGQGGATYPPDRTDTLSTPTGYTRLVWNGTGSGNAIDAHSTGLSGAGVQTFGFTMRNLVILYSSASYTGRLISLVGAAFSEFDSVNFAHTAASVTATCAVTLDQVVGVLFTDCDFSGYLAYIRGRDIGFSNVAAFRDCTFQGNCVHALVNPGLDYLLDGCTFEMWDAAQTSCITADITYPGNSDPVVLTLRSCYFWDTAAGSQKYIFQPSTAGVAWKVLLDGCMDENIGGLTKTYDFQGNGSIEFRGGRVYGPIDFGNGAVAGSQKDQVVVDGTLLSHASNNAMLQNIGTGHVVVETALSGSVSGNVVRQHGAAIRAVTHEVASGGDQPTVTIHAGVSNLAVVWGNALRDLTGVVAIQNNGVGASATGLIADVTFNTPILGPSSVSTERHPVVVVSGISISGGFAGGPTAAACQPYVSVTVNDETKFSIGIVNPIPAGAVAQFAYRVTVL